MKMLSFSTSPRSLLWLFFFGSIWGINEVVTGEILYRIDAPNPSIFLSVSALFILAMARGMFNRPGSSTLIGIFAVLFRLVNAAPSYCHLLGIFLLGLTFDVLISVFLKNKEKALLKYSLIGGISAYGNNAQFAILITYIFRNKYWVAGGLPRVANHIIVNGSISALLAAVVAPVGFWIGKKGELFAEARPRWSYAGTFLGSIVLWTLAKLLV